MRSLIELTQKAVLDQFGINLELEVELIGEW
jgi:UDP-N-acetylenolpyruvoylglucosamine reductase